MAKKQNATPKKIVATIALDRKSLPIIIILSVAMCIATLPYVTWLSAAHDLPRRAPHSGSLDLLIVVCVATLLIHEAVHALAYMCYGVRPKFGAKLIAWVLPVLTTSAKGAKLTLGRMLVVGLSPFVVLSLATTFLAADPTYTVYALAAFAVNFIGSVGDVYMAAKLLHYLGKAGRLVEDTGTSFIVVEVGKRRIKRE